MIALAERPERERDQMAAIDRIATHLNQGQLEQLARFLETPGDGTLAINRANGYVEVRGSARPLFAASSARRDS